MMQPKKQKKLHSFVQYLRKTETVCEIFRKAGITEGDDGKSDDSAEEDTVVSL